MGRLCSSWGREWKGVDGSGDNQEEDGDSPVLEIWSARVAQGGERHRRKANWYRRRRHCELWGMERKKRLTLMVKGKGKGDGRRAQRQLGGKGGGRRDTEDLRVIAE